MPPNEALLALIKNNPRESRFIARNLCQCVWNNRPILDGGGVFVIFSFQIAS